LLELIVLWDEANCHPAHGIPRSMGALVPIPGPMDHMGGPLQGTFLCPILIIPCQYGCPISHHPMSGWDIPLMITCHRVSGVLCPKKIPTLPPCPTTLLPYCPTALPPYCPTALPPYCHITTLLPYHHTIILPHHHSCTAIPHYCLIAPPPYNLLSHCLKMVVMNVCILNICSVGCCTV
jgi:hypothetical protein